MPAIITVLDDTVGSTAKVHDKYVLSISFTKLIYINLFTIFSKNQVFLYFSSFYGTIIALYDLVNPNFLMFYIFMTINKDKLNLNTLIFFKL